MVEQLNPSKASSTGGGPPHYEVRAVVRCDAPLPKTTVLSIQKDIAGGVHSYIIEGTTETERASVPGWDEPPHRVFANLPAAEAKLQPAMEPRPIQPAAAQAFIEKYGVMLNRLGLPAGFRVNSRDLSFAQSLLRRAWQGDAAAIVPLQTVGVKSDSILQTERAIEEAQPRVEASVLARGIELTASDLWSFICVLFLRDHAAGRTGVCVNPDCPAPYFLKRRRTQKFCEAGTCVAHAQRQYALRWWNIEGKKRRARKQAKAKRRKQK